jgi:SMODS and SLOG-associating 2TM effector domain family 5
MKDFFQSLQTQAWITMGARYNAARRLRRKDLLATFSIASFSAIGIALAVVQKVYVQKSTPELDSYITVVSACIGLFVLVISLIEWGASGAVKADALHRNAELLNQFQRKIEQDLASSLALDETLATARRQEYEDIKAVCAHNHEPVDDVLFRAQQRLSKEFRKDCKPDGKPQMTWAEGKWAELMALWSAAWAYFAFWTVILGLLWNMPWGH